MGLLYPTFMGRNLENKKKLMLVRIMNSTSLNNKIIVNNIGIFNDDASIKANSKNNASMNIVSCEYSCDEQ